MGQRSFIIFIYIVLQRPPGGDDTKCTIAFSQGCHSSIHRSVIGCAPCSHHRHIKKYSKITMQRIFRQYSNNGRHGKVPDHNIKKEREHCILHNQHYSSHLLWPCLHLEGHLLSLKNNAWSSAVLSEHTNFHLKCSKDICHFSCIHVTGFVARWQDNAVTLMSLVFMFAHMLIFLAATQSYINYSYLNVCYKCHPSHLP